MKQRVSQTTWSPSYSCSFPDSNVTTETNMLEDMEFSSEQRVSHGHEGVGSGKWANLQIM